jgi:predicted esterase
MLHGLSGDERSMWALEPALPSVGTLVAPRGIYPSQFGGYSWRSDQGSNPVAMVDFDPAAAALVRVMQHLERHFERKVESWFLMGFSQGAACCFALACSDYALEFGSILGLIVIAGFLPAGDISNLRGTPIYWGHGVKDSMVPVNEARKAVENLRSNGAEIDYCEADVGHKLGIECLKGLRQWYQDLETG